MLSKSFDSATVRAQFPALARMHGGKPLVFFDGPAGAQIPQRVASEVARFLTEDNGNTHGVFPTSQRTDQMLADARAALADFLGADDPECVTFGANMTTLTFALSRSLAKTWKAGDEIIVTRLDHDANITPWVLAAKDAGAVVKRVEFDRDCRLNLDDLAAKLSPRTRLVAVGAASNAFGTVNPVADIVRRAHKVGALTFIDAVHYAPHRLIDVAAWNCDFLACSVYKFFGPHVGVLWGKRALLEQLPAYKVRPAGDDVAEKFSTGTLNHEGIAGAREAIEYLADLGRPAETRRAAIVRAFERIGDVENQLGRRLLEGLGRIPGVRVHGITDLSRQSERVPTVAITHQNVPAQKVAEFLAERGIYVWNGNFYALEASESLGLEPDGMVRIGLLHYNTPAEVDRLLEALASLG